MTLRQWLKQWIDFPIKFIRCFWSGDSLQTFCNGSFNKISNFRDLRHIYIGRDGACIASGFCENSTWPKWKLFCQVELSQKLHEMHRVQYRTIMQPLLVSLNLVATAVLNFLKIEAFSAASANVSPNSLFLSHANKIKARTYCDIRCSGLFCSHAKYRNASSIRQIIKGLNCNVTSFTLMWTWDLQMRQHKLFAFSARNEAGHKVQNSLGRCPESEATWPNLNRFALIRPH